MTVEFEGLKYSKELSVFVSEMESQPEWKNALTVRESASRIISLRGRLLGERPHDRQDLQYDLSSYRRLNIEPQDVESALRFLIKMESAYYKYATKLAIWQARKYGHSDREDDYIDTAKNLVAWSVWNRWKPDPKNNQNNLHPHIIRTLDFLPQLAYHSYAKNSPINEEMKDSYDPLIPFEEKSEVPIYRLRRSISNLTLEQTFTKLTSIPNRERLAVLCVMGYVPGVNNLTQGTKFFHINKEAFSKAFDRGVDLLNSTNSSRETVDAFAVVENTISQGLIRNPDGTIASSESPRLKLSSFTNTEILSDQNRQIYFLAKELNGNQFRYSIEEIGRIVGGLSVFSISHRINRIVKILESA